MVEETSLTPRLHRKRKLPTERPGCRCIFSLALLPSALPASARLLTFHHVTACLVASVQTRCESSRPTLPFCGKPWLLVLFCVLYSTPLVWFGFLLPCFVLFLIPAFSLDCFGLHCIAVLLLVLYLSFPYAFIYSALPKHNL